MVRAHEYRAFAGCEQEATVCGFDTTELLDLAPRHPYRVHSMVSLPETGLNSLARGIQSDGNRLKGTIPAARKNRASVRTSTQLVSSADTHPPLDEYYNSLFTALGPQHWWPGKTSFEVVVGAILTQNTSWRNVETAITNLRNAGLLSPDGIEKVSARRLESLIRSSGYFRQKARKLKDRKSVV